MLIRQETLIFALAAAGIAALVAWPRKRFRVWVAGMLAFFDPVGGGGVFPPFFQTADRVTLVNGGSSFDPALVCGCGDDSAYIVGGVQRADLMDEAGCAGQL